MRRWHQRAVCLYLSRGKQWSSPVRVERNRCSASGSGARQRWKAVGHTEGVRIIPDYAHGAGRDRSGLGSAGFHDSDPGFDLSHGFALTGSMTTARDWHTATLLKDGTVLVTGGVNNSAFPTSAEIFDPATASFTATGSMASVRVSASATLLNNGKVLLAGGKAADGSQLATAELYDPASGTFAATGNMNAARAYHTATLLNDGRVLVAGGFDATAEIFDPSTGTFTLTGRYYGRVHDGDPAHYREGAGSRGPTRWERERERRAVRSKHRDIYCHRHYVRWARRAYRNVTP